MKTITKKRKTSLWLKTMALGLMLTGMGAYKAMAQAPVAGFKTYLNGNSVEIEFKCQGTIEYLFLDYGDGESESFDTQFVIPTSVAHLYSAGTYNVCLTAVDSATMQSDVLCKTITITAASCIDNSVIIPNWHPEWHIGDKVCGCDSVTYSSKDNAYYGSGVTSWTKGACKQQTQSCQADFDYYIINYPGTVQVYDKSTGVDSNTTVSISFDGGKSSVGINGNWTYPAEHIYKNAGVYDICVTLKNKKTGCSDKLCKQILIGDTTQPCEAAFNVVDSAGQWLRFWNTSLGITSTTLRHYDFGDGTTDDFVGKNDPQPYHQYSTPGTYLVCLTISDSTTNCSSTTCDTFYVANDTTPCQAWFTNNNYWPSVGESIPFINQSIGTGANTTVVYDFGDGSSSSSWNPYHSYSKTGTYIICMTISDSAKGCYNTFCDTIVVYPDSTPCFADFNYSVMDSNGIMIVQLWNISTSNSFEWMIQGKDTVLHSTLSSLTLDASLLDIGGGWFYACLTVSGQDSCTDTKCDSIFLKLASTEQKAENIKELKIMPNPFSDNTTIEYSLNEAGTVEISVYDILGNKVETLINNTERTGTHQINWNAAQHPAGMYFVNIRTADELQIQKVILRK